MHDSGNNVSSFNGYEKTRHMDELLDAVLEQFVRATHSTAGKPTNLPFFVLFFSHARKSSLTVVGGAGKCASRIRRWHTLHDTRSPQAQRRRRRRRPLRATGKDPQPRGPFREARQGPAHDYGGGKLGLRRVISWLSVYVLK